MSNDRLVAAAALQAFAPRTRFDDLARDHVPFDVLVGSPRHEARVLETLTGAHQPVVVVGGRGGGKSSLIADVCSRLGAGHVALRVPVTGADDPANVSAVAAIALSTAIRGLSLDHHQRLALEEARADEVLRRRAPARAGGKLGGGPVPAEVRAELETLEVELTTQRLAGERLAGLDRLVSILVFRGLTPIFVMEDTEAVIGGPDGVADADGFFRGPVKAFLQEVEAPLLIAVQSHIAERSKAFGEVAPSFRRIDVPDLGDGAGEAIAAIADRRLSDSGLDVRVHDVLDQGTLEVLAAWYAESGRSLRHTLAALQSAADHAADAGADAILVAHALAAVADWRLRP